MPPALASIAITLARAVKETVRCGGANANDASIQISLASLYAEVSDDATSLSTKPWPHCSCELGHLKNLITVTFKVFRALANKSGQAESYYRGTDKVVLPVLLHIGALYV